MISSLFSYQPKFCSSKIVGGLTGRSHLLLKIHCSFDALFGNKSQDRATKISSQFQIGAPVNVFCFEFSFDSRPVIYSQIHAQHKLVTNAYLHVLFVEWWCRCAAEHPVKMTCCCFSGESIKFFGC